MRRPFKGLLYGLRLYTRLIKKYVWNIKQCIKIPWCNIDFRFFVWTLWLLSIYYYFSPFIIFLLKLRTKIIPPSLISECNLYICMYNKTATHRCLYMENIWEYLLVVVLINIMEMMMMNDDDDWWIWQTIIFINNFLSQTA